MAAGSTRPARASRKNRRRSCRDDDDRHHGEDGGNAHGKQMVAELGSNAFARGSFIEHDECRSAVSDRPTNRQPDVEVRRRDGREDGDEWPKSPLVQS
jgi:hypothetical protein